MSKLQDGKLNIGVVGLGRMGKQHALNALRRVPRVRLLCVCSRGQRGIQWAKEHLEPEGVLALSSFEEMIQTTALHAVVIASPTDCHIAQTRVAIQHNVHVLCEKPLTNDISELRGLMEFMNTQSSAKVMVGFVRRFDDDYQQAIQKLKGGSIGHPIIIRSQSTEKRDTSGFFASYARGSGGIFVDSAIHDIDITLAILGDNVKPKALWARGIVSSFPELKDFGDADNSVGVVEFWDGRIAYYYHSRTTAHGWDNCTEIIGTEGKISVNLIPTHNRVQISSCAGLMQDMTPSWLDRYKESFARELEVFAGAILDGRDLPLSLSSAYTGLRIATGLQESLRTGQKLEFNEEGNRI